MVIETQQPGGTPTTPPVSEVTPEVVVPESEPWRRAEFDSTTPEAGEPTAPVAEVPAPPVVPTPTPAPIDPRIQQELAALRQQVSQDRAQLAQRETQVQEQENQRIFETAVTQLQKELEEQDGMSPERAQIRAQREIGAAWQAYQAERNAQIRITDANAKIEVATIIAEQHKVPVRTLLQYNTPQAMQEAAERVTTQNTQAAEIAELKAQIAKLTRGSVPAQQYALAAGAMAGNPTLEALAAKDTRKMTLAELEQHGKLLDAALLRGR